MSNTNLFAKFNVAKLAADTELVPDELEVSMVSEYDSKSPLGTFTHPFKIALNGQEGIYHDLSVLVPQLNLWISKGISFVDFRFSVVQAPGINAGKFTVLIIPVESKVNLDGSRDRIPQNGTDETKSVDLGDLHP